MTQLEQQMIDELVVAQGFTNNLAANLNTKGVPSNIDEGLDTLVPKVLQIDSGDAQTPYDLWQEGFGYNWDNVVANAPISGYKVLHLYQKRNFLKLVSNFPSAAQCCVWSKNANAYRVVELDGSKTIIFEEGESFVNSHDSSEYLCVVYSGNWNSASYFYKLPVVYVNSRACTQTIVQDFYANCLSVTSENVPFLRGVDCYSLQRIFIHPSLEHLSFQTLSADIQINGARGGAVQGRMLKNMYDAKPESTPMYMFAHPNIAINFSDLDLADDFYTKISVFPFSYASNTFYNFPTTNNARRFKFDSSFNLSFSGGYVGGIPSAEILEGTITEDQEYVAGSGRHGFNKSEWTVLRNFPMWTVLSGASTGCLLPAQSAHPSANFRFYSMQLERSNFALFNDGVIDTDPTKSFVANLPTVLAGSAQSITFDDTTFKNQFTANEQAQIVSTITGKNWGLTW